MTTPTSDEPFPPVFDGDQAPPPPFDDQVTFTITKQIELTQLAEEIGKAVGRQVSLAQLGPDAGFVPSADNPATLCVSPGSVDKKIVQKAIDDHEPIVGYDVPERIKAFNVLQDRLVNDPDADMSDEDIKVAVRGLIIREAGRQPGPA